MEKRILYWTILCMGEYFFSFNKHFFPLGLTDLPHLFVHRQGRVLKKRSGPKKPGVTIIIAECLLKYYISVRANKVEMGFGNHTEYISFSVFFVYHLHMKLAPKLS